jgi:putative YphP/YqiW family bacilliredoxin
MQNLPLSPLYDPTLVQPMRDEVTELGVQELRTSEDVTNAFNQSGTTLVFVNSVCGCSAGGARPALRLALSSETLPDRTVSVFAGQDREATEEARSHFHGIPPSSPMFVLLNDGEVVHVLPRHDIEGYTPEQIADNLAGAFNAYCGQKA